MLVDVKQIQILAWLIHNERDRFAPAMEIPTSPLLIQSECGDTGAWKDRSDGLRLLLGDHFSATP